ncbi:MAG: PspC domain-containing protein [Actinomycetota bacterium]
MVAAGRVRHDAYMSGPPSPPVPPAPPPSAPPGADFTRSLRRLRRSRRDRMLGGVAGGMAETYGWDPTVVRLAWVVAAIFGVGAPAYLVAWIVVPSADDGWDHDDDRDRGALVALLLLGVGVLWLASMLLPNRPHFFNIGWPLALVAGGVAVLLFRARDDGSDNELDGGEPRPSPWEPLAADVAAADTETDTEAQPGDDTHDPSTAATAETTTSAWTQTEDWPGGPCARRRWGGPPWHHGGWNSQWHDDWHRRRRNRPKPFLGPLVISVLLVGAGIAALVEVLDIAEIDLQAAAAVALAVVGVALVVSAWYGRARGLVLLGILLTIKLSVLAVIDVPLEGGIGDRLYRPTTVADVRDEYRLAMGQMTVDLRDVPFREGTRTVEASVGMGELQVQLPDDVSVRVDAHSGAGVVKLFGREAEGWDVDDDRVVTEPGGATLVLDLEVGFGGIEVVRYADEDVETVVTNDDDEVAR